MYNVSQMSVKQHPPPVVLCCVVFYVFGFFSSSRLLGDSNLGSHSPDKTEEMAAKALSLSPQPGFSGRSKSVRSRRKLTN